MGNPSLVDFTDSNDLLTKLAQSDEYAFEFVFHQYYPRICLYALQFTENDKEAEDIAKDAFIKIWKGKKEFESIDHLKSSIYQATKHVGLNYREKNSRSIKREEVYLYEQEKFELNHLDYMIESEVFGTLYQAIQKLPEQARKIIISTYLEGQSNQEVADSMNLSLQTVKNHKLRALNLLRKQLNMQTFQLLTAGYFIINHVSK